MKTKSQPFHSRVRVEKDCVLMRLLCFFEIVVRGTPERSNSDGADRRVPPREVRERGMHQQTRHESRPPPDQHQRNVDDRSDVVHAGRVSVSGEDLHQWRQRHWVSTGELFERRDVYTEGLRRRVSHSRIYQIKLNQNLFMEEITKIKINKDEINMN